MVPFYNEEKRIEGKKLELLCSLLPSSPIYFIDDGSSDATQEILIEFIDNHKNYKIQLIANDVNLGKAEALRRGLIEAMHHKEIKFVAFTDGDLATPPREILRFLNIVINSDAAAYLGVRAKSSGSISTTLFRKWQGGIFNGLSKHILQIDLQDPQCGMKAFQVSQTLREIISAPFVDKWLFDIELLLRLKVANPNFRYSEISLIEWHHKRNSKIKKFDPVRMFFNLLKLRQIYIA